MPSPEDTHRELEPHLFVLTSDDRVVLIDVKYWKQWLEEGADESRLGGGEFGMGSVICKLDVDIRWMDCDDKRQILIKGADAHLAKTEEIRNKPLKLKRFGRKE